MNMTLKKIKKPLYLLLMSVIFSTAAFSAQKDESEEPAKEKSDKKTYIGWIDSTGRDIDAKFGLLRLKSKPRLGTFNIGVINRNGRTLPVLSGNNEFTSSYFCLRVNNKVYKLRAEANIKTFAQRTNNGIRVLYDIADVAEVLVIFDTLKSAPDNDVDMIKVSAKVTNKGDKKGDFALKTILDTVLGEITPNHFYTSNNKPVKDELLVRDLSASPYFYSQNNNAIMQIFFAGADCTVPELVALANYSSLEKNSWDLDTSFSHGFDTVLSYNNSGVGAVWPAVRLSPNASNTCVFYIAFATDGDDANGLAYIDPSKAPKVATKQEPVEEKEQLQVTTEILPLFQNNEPVADSKIPVEVPVAQSAPVTSPLAIPNPNPQPQAQAPQQTNEPLLQEFLPSQNTVQQSQNQNPVQNPKMAVPSDPSKVAANQTGRVPPNVKFEVSSFSQNQLTPEYIQALIDRIVALEDSGTSVNREELLQLNAELDAILSVLRN